MTHPPTWPTPWLELNQSQNTPKGPLCVCVLSALHAHCACMWTWEVAAPCRCVSLPPLLSTIAQDGVSHWPSLSGWTEWTEALWTRSVCMLLLARLPCWGLQADIEMWGIGHPNSSPHACTGKTLKANSPDPLVSFLKSFLLVYINYTY